MSNKSFNLDAHFHLDLYNNYQKILTDIRNQNISILAVTNAPSVFHFTKKISLDYHNVLPAIGFHPELVHERIAELDFLLKSIPNERYIGEVGLDYSTKYSSEEKNLQKQVFEKILVKCSEVGTRVISIHSRRAASDVIAMVGKDFPGTVILHWYSGNISDLKKAIENGFYFSVNPAMIKYKTGQKIIERLPQTRILTETDGPFIDIENNHPAEPQHIKNVIKYLSIIWHLGFDEANSIIRENIRTAGFSFPRN